MNHHVTEAEINQLFPDEYLTLTGDIRAVTLEIMNNTIHRQRNSPFMNNSGMVQYAKTICKNLKRPYIPYGTTWIDIPKKKFLDPIHAPLKLVAHKLQGGWMADQEHDVMYTENTVYVGYRFVTETGCAVFRDWFKRTQTDPDMRRALRLPPTVG